jgi:hypothetical protein
MKASGERLLRELHGAGDGVARLLAAPVVNVKLVHLIRAVSASGGTYPLAFYKSYL